jgi:hypothetical protein
MLRRIWARYGAYPKRRGKKRSQRGETPFFHRSYEWLRWKTLEQGGFSFRLPCLGH